MGGGHPENCSLTSQLLEKSNRRMIHQNDQFLRNGRIKNKKCAKIMIFSRCFHGLGHRIQVRWYRKIVLFLHNSASTLCYP